MLLESRDCDNHSDFFRRIHPAFEARVADGMLTVQKVGMKLGEKLIRRQHGYVVWEAVKEVYGPTWKGKRDLPKLPSRRVAK
jgi:hypothetical protein